MPNRVLRDWTDSFAIDQLSFPAEVFFTRLIMKADDYGRFFGDPRLLKSLLFPLKSGMTDREVAEYLAECVRAGLLLLYRQNGKEYVEIRNFGQRLRVRRTRFPQPPPDDGNPRSDDSNVRSHDSNVRSHDSNVRSHDSNPPSHDSNVRPEVEEEVEEEINIYTTRVCAREKDPPESAIWQSAEAIWSLYPKRREQRGDLSAIAAAIEREAAKPGETLESAASRIRDATAAYAGAVSEWPKNRKCFIASCQKWFAESRFLDDPDTWSQYAPPEKKRFNVRDPSTWEE